MAKHWGLLQVSKRKTFFLLACWASSEAKSESDICTEQHDFSPSSYLKGALIIARPRTPFALWFLYREDHRAPCPQVVFLGRTVCELQTDLRQPLLKLFM